MCFACIHALICVYSSYWQHAKKGFSSSSFLFRTFILIKNEIEIIPSTFLLMQITDELSFHYYDPPLSICSGGGQLKATEQMRCE